MIDLISKSIPKGQVSDYYCEIKNLRVKIVSALYKIKNTEVISEIFPIIEGISELSCSDDFQTPRLSSSLNSILIYHELKDKINTLKLSDQDKATVKIILQSINELNKLSFPKFHLTKKTIDQCHHHLRHFVMETQERLLTSGKGEDFAKIFNLNGNIKPVKFETLYLGEESFNRDTLIATQKEYTIKKRLVETEFVKPELQEARTAWLKIIEESKDFKTKSARNKFIEESRQEHFKLYPFLNRYQELIDKKFESVDELIELLPVLPYAHYNIKQFAKLQNKEIKDLFTNNLCSNSISLLSDEKLTENNIDAQNYHGECFARKKMSHGLFSESEIFIWVRNNIDLFSMIYTVGHELIHYQQIREAMNMEKNSLRTSSMSFASFLNYYGNFLGLSSRNVEKLNCLTRNNRRILYGYDLYTFPNNRLKLLNNLKKSLIKNDKSWNNLLKKLGSLIGMILPTSPAIKTKALQEVLPALENAKNILFAKELGLNIAFDEVASALPTANKYQRKVYSQQVNDLVNSTDRSWDSLRIIANHQINGVYFHPKENEQESLTLNRSLTPIFLGSSYNQTQQ
jgi:hypothetical protein